MLPIESWNPEIIFSYVTYSLILCSRTAYILFKQEFIFLFNALFYIHYVRMDTHLVHYLS